MKVFFWVFFEYRSEWNRIKYSLKLQLKILFIRNYLTSNWRFWYSHFDFGVLHVCFRISISFIYHKEMHQLKTLALVFLQHYSYHYWLFNLTDFKKSLVDKLFFIEMKKNWNFNNWLAFFVVYWSLHSKCLLFFSCQPAKIFNCWVFDKSPGKLRIIISAPSVFCRKIIS